MPSLALLVGTNQALLRFDVRRGCFSLLSTGAGHYYGVAAVSLLSGGLRGGDNLLLVGSQASHAFRNVSGLEGDELLLVDAEARRAVGAWALPSLYLHNSAVRRWQSELWVVDTQSAIVYVVGLVASASSPAAGSAAASLGSSRLVVHRQIRTVPSERAGWAHLNEVRFDPGGRAWVMFHHGSRTSELRRLRADDGEDRTYRLGGSACHGIAFWWPNASSAWAAPNPPAEVPRGMGVVYLLSAIGGVGLLDADTGRSEELWRAGPEFFAKGLFVSGGVAYFGLSRVTRQNTTEAARFARNNASCELLALELRTRRLLWRRQLPFRGLVNAIEAPWLPRL